MYNKSNTKESEKSPQLIEERVREIVREEIWSILIGISKERIKDIERADKYLNSVMPHF